jgi:hypothetical protein
MIGSEFDRTPVPSMRKVRELHNYDPKNMNRTRYEPGVKIPALGSVFPEGIMIPDYFWFPVKGKRVVRRWMQTQWGRLFDSYGDYFRSRREMKSRAALSF